MASLQLLGLSLGTAFASGLNLYATVAVLGLLQRLRLIELPSSLQILSHPVVLAVAIGLYLIEFVADKVPYVDSVWDVIHTFIRPPAAAFLTYSAFAGTPESWRIAASLLGGGVALTSHGTKASARAAANASPEPFSNSILSLGEDGFAILLTWMATRHPLITIVVVVLLVVLSVFIVVKLFKFLAGIFTRTFGRQRGVQPSPAK
jgi:hypothetical protein